MFVGPLWAAGEDGLFFDFTDRRTMFSDIGGTVRANVGDTVLYIAGKSGNSYALTQSTPAKACVLGLDAQGNYHLIWTGAEYYDCSAGGQWTQFSAFAAITPSQVVSTRVVLSMQSTGVLGASLNHLGSGRLSIFDGATSLTAVTEYPAPAFVPNQFGVIGGVYDGTNAFAYQGDFKGSPVAATISPSTTPGFRLGRARFTTGGTGYAGLLYGVFLVNRKMSVAECSTAIAALSTLKQQGVLVNSFSYARSLIEGEAGNVNIFVDGDSTGDAKDEWVYRFTLTLAAKYPKHTVTYQRFDNVTTKTYVEADTVQTGTGSRTINIWNGSVSLSIPSQLMGGSYATAVAALPGCDLVIWNHGHNMGGVTDTPTLRGEYLGAMEQVRQTWPSAHHAALLQNPNRDDFTQEPVLAELKKIAVDRPELLLVDAYSPFIAVNKAPAYYAPAGLGNYHPSGSAGSKLQASSVMAAWNAAAIDATAAAGTPWYSTTATNLLANGDFAGYASGTPASWSLIGTPTLSKDTGVFDAARKTFSLEIQNASAAIQGISQSIPLTGLAGGTITLSARLQSEIAYSLSGRISVVVTGTAGGAITYKNLADGAEGGAFFWTCIAGIPVPSDVTSIVVNLYASQAATAGQYTHYDRAVLIAGSIPHDMV